MAVSLKKFIVRVLLEEIALRSAPRVVGIADNMEVSAPPGPLHFPAIELKRFRLFSSSATT